MNNYVNKENADGLKRIGFDVACQNYYSQLEFEITDTINNWSEYNGMSSASDFLTVADWFWEKHKILIVFEPLATVIKIKFKILKNMMPILFDGDNHRNAAIAKAIQIVKSRIK